MVVEIYNWSLWWPHSAHITSAIIFVWSQQKNTYQSSSVAQSCLTLCAPVVCSTPGLPVHHWLPEFTQTHVHRVSDAIQPSHPLSSPSPPDLSLSQHQGLFQWVSSSHMCVYMYVCVCRRYMMQGSLHVCVCVCVCVEDIWFKELTHWKRPWCWEKLRTRGEGDDRGWDGWMASPTWWAWAWASSGSWWQTGKPGLLQSMGLKRVGHNLATEQQQHICFVSGFCYKMSVMQKACG